MRRTPACPTSSLLQRPASSRRPPRGCMRRHARSSAPSARGRRLGKHPTPSRARRRRAATWPTSRRPSWSRRCRRGRGVCSNVVVFARRFIADDVRQRRRRYTSRRWPTVAMVTTRSRPSALVANLGVEPRERDSRLQLGVRGHADRIGEARRLGVVEQGQFACLWRSDDRGGAIERTMSELTLFPGGRLEPARALTWCAPSSSWIGDDAANTEDKTTMRGFGLRTPAGSVRHSQPSPRESVA